MIRRLKRRTKYRVRWCAVFSLGQPLWSRPRTEKRDRPRIPRPRRKSRGPVWGVERFSKWHRTNLPHA